MTLIDPGLDGWFEARADAPRSEGLRFARVATVDRGSLPPMISRFYGVWASASLMRRTMETPPEIQFLPWA
jgi:hypothetical protein